jgi:hypothetical protein
MAEELRAAGARGVGVRGVDPRAERSGEAPDEPARVAGKPSTSRSGALPRPNPSSAAAGAHHFAHDHPVTIGLSKLQDGARSEGSPAIVTLEADQSIHLDSRVTVPNLADRAHEEGVSQDLAVPEPETSAAKYLVPRALSRSEPLSEVRVEGGIQDELRLLEILIQPWGKCPTAPTPALPEVSACSRDSRTVGNPARIHTPETQVHR